MAQNQLGKVNRKAKDMSENGNENWQLGRNIPLSRVDQLADDLAEKFDNVAYRKWYVVAIYDLGEERINIILGRVSDARFPGKLFTHYVNQERNSLRNKWLLEQQRKNFGNG